MTLYHSLSLRVNRCLNMTVTLSHGYSVFFLIHPLRLSLLQLSQTSQNKVPSRLAPWAPHRYRSSCEENRFLPFDAFRPWQKKTARCRIYFMFLCDPFLMVLGAAPGFVLRSFLTIECYRDQVVPEVKLWPPACQAFIHSAC